MKQLFSRILASLVVVALIFDPITLRAMAPQSPNPVLQRGPTRVCFEQEALAAALTNFLAAFSNKRAKIMQYKWIFRFRRPANPEKEAFVNQIASLGVEVIGAQHAPAEYLEDLFRILKKIPDDKRRQSIGTLRLRPWYRSLHVLLGAPMGLAFGGERRAMISLVIPRGTFQWTAAHEIGHLLLLNDPETADALRDVSWQHVPFSHPAVIFRTMAAFIATTAAVTFAAREMPGPWYAYYLFIGYFIAAWIFTLPPQPAFLRKLMNPGARLHIFNAAETTRWISAYGLMNSDEEGAELVAAYLLYANHFAAQAAHDPFWQTKYDIIRDGLFDGIDLGQEPTYERLTDEPVSLPRSRIMLGILLMQAVSTTLIFLGFIKSAIVLLVFLGASMIAWLSRGAVPMSLRFRFGDYPRPSVELSTAEAVARQIGAEWLTIVQESARVWLILVFALVIRIAAGGAEPLGGEVRLIFGRPHDIVRLYLPPPASKVETTKNEGKDQEEVLIFPWNGTITYLRELGGVIEYDRRPNQQPFDVPNKLIRQFGRVNAISGKLPSIDMRRLQEVIVYFRRAQAAEVFVTFEHYPPGIYMGDYLSTLPAKPVNIIPGQPLRVTREQFYTDLRMTGPANEIIIGTLSDKNADAAPPQFEIDHIEIHLGPIQNQPRIVPPEPRMSQNSTTSRAAPVAIFLTLAMLGGLPSPALIFSAGVVSLWVIHELLLMIHPCSPLRSKLTRHAA